eukprot:gene8405-11383_t
MANGIKTKKILLVSTDRTFVQDTKTAFAASEIIQLLTVEKSVTELRGEVQVHRAQLPLLQRVVDAAQKAQVLFVVGDGEPHLFKLGNGTEELFVFVVGAKTHHPLDARAVVPAA